MILRFILFVVLLGAAVRFVGRLLMALMGQQPPVQKQKPAKQRPPDLDPSQIQDADFKDL